MPNYSKKLLELHNHLETLAFEENKPIAIVFKDFSTIFNDKLAIAISKDHKTLSGVEIQKKYQITPKFFRKLILKTGFKPKKYRQVKSFIYKATQGMNTTHQEYETLARYFEKHELIPEKAIEKLIKIRNKK